LLRKDVKPAPPCQGLDAIWLLRIDVYELTAIITFGCAQDLATDDTRLRIAAGRNKIGLCHHRDFLHKYMLMPKSIDQSALHEPWKRVIDISGNDDSHFWRASLHGLLLDIDAGTDCLRRKVRRPGGRAETQGYRIGVDWSAVIETSEKAAVRNGSQPEELKLSISSPLHPTERT